MKKLLFFCVLSVLCIPFLGVSQQRYVLKVTGQIENQRTGKVIRKGDEILPDDQLKFANKDSKALVISRQKGREIISVPETNLENKDGAFGDFGDFIVSSILPPKSNRRLSARGAAKNGSSKKETEEIRIESPLGDLGQILVFNRRYIMLGDSLRHYDGFLLHYLKDNQDVFQDVFLGLRRTGNRLTIKKSELKHIGDEAKAVELYGFVRATNKFEKAAEMSLVVPNVAKLKQEIALIKKHTKPSQLDEEIEFHIRYTYCCDECTSCFHLDDLRVFNKKQGSDAHSRTRH